MGVLQTLFWHILNMGITASYVILAVIVIRSFIRRAPKVFSYGLWAAVGFRLIFPISFSSFFSILNLFQRNIKDSSDGTIQYIPADISYLQPKVPSITAQNTAGINITGTNSITYANQPYTAPVSAGDPMKLLLFAATLIWSVGVIAMLCYGIISYIKLKKQLQRAVLWKDNIYESESIPSPFVLGLIRPRIYIPFRLKEQELNYILMHEQYHIKRLDHLIKPLSFLLLSVYWFNPLVWVAYFCMDKDMEMSCDEKVISHMGMFIKNDYSSSLLSFAVNRRMPLVGPLTFGETNTKSRIKNVLNFKKPRVIISSLITIICILVILTCAANPLRGGRKTAGDAGRTISDTENITDYARQLYDCKNPYIGNVSADGKLIRTLNVGKELGNFTTELETAQKPYILRLNFDDEVKSMDAFDIKMYRYASVLLALIDNADEIQWSYPNVNNGGMTRITVYWNSENLKTLGIKDIKGYGKSAGKVQALLSLLDKKDLRVNFTRAENVTDNNDGKPQDNKIVTMNDVLAVKDWSSFTFDYFKAFANAVMSDTDKDALNSYIDFALSYGEDTYQLRVSYMKADHSIDMIIMQRDSDSDVILLYSADPKYKVNTDVQTFLNTKISMNKFLTYKLPDSLTDGEYNAALGYDGGNLFYKDGRQPQSPSAEWTPVEWYSYGGVYRLPYQKADSTVDAGNNNFVTFENGKLVRGYLFDNHTETIGKPIPLKNTKEQAVIMETQHDLYTAAELYDAEEAGKAIPKEEQTSTMYEIYFAREDGHAAYCIFLNKKYFSLKDAKTLAKSVQFKEGAFE